MTAAECFQDWLVTRIHRDDPVDEVALITWCAQVRGGEPEPVERCLNRSATLTACARLTWPWPSL
jgi:hypothetical protein